MPKLLVPGVEIPPEKRREELLDGALRIEVSHASRVEALVRGAAIPEIPVDAADDDVVEVELEGGAREWMSVAQLRADLEEHGVASPDRSGAPVPEDGVVRIPVLLPRGPQTRAAGGWILKGLRILRISPSDALADLAADAIVARFEDKRPTPSGVYPCPDSFVLDPGRALKAGDIAADGGLLVLFHGTASSTQGSFGKMAGTREWDDLRRQYGSRIFALEHHTLSVSPLANAIDLLEILPVGAVLHMISHSRGGLIGELLCRGAIAESDLAPFGKRPDDLRLFRRLGELLREKRPRVERFVRVACPARGTLLASRRLDRYLSVILNLFGLIPAFRTTPLDVLYEILRATLLTLAKKRTDPRELPGLEAMMPESPLIHLLNQTSTTTTDELGVIAGDVQGQGLWGSLKILATDVFYREDHDLVVNTRSMYGGAAREKVAVFFDKGPDVNHFSYFGNDGSRRQLHTWLTRTKGEREALFAEIRPEPPGEVRGEAFRAEDHRDVVFLVPDFLGSELADDQGKIWPDPQVLAHGGLFRLATDRRVDAGAPVPQPYADLVKLLSHQVRVVPLPYDWRASVLDSAGLLTAGVAAELDRHGQRVSFLAHGLGGLVVRALIARDRELWRKVRERGGHLVMLGTPSHGTLFAARLLLGEETLLRQLDLLDIGHGLEELTGLFAGFPALLEMLPEGGEIDLFDPASWRLMARACPALGVPEPQALSRARGVRARLDEALKETGTDGMLYVAGTAPWTPARLAWKGAAGEQPPLFEGTREGDGRVPHALGRLSGAPTWYADTSHGGLVREGAFFAALLELLQRGETRLLPPRPPEGTSPELLPPPAPEPLLFPDTEDLLAAAFGYSTAAPLVTDLLALRVSVAHGDLKYARFPVAVGHYENDTIVSAEKLLDRQLNGALTERHRLGLYPGPRGTVEVALVPGASPPGALVIGFGEVGQITPALVRDGVARVVLRHALAVAEPAGSGGAGSWRSAAFSAVLLGTGGGRSISVEESVAAIVEGALQANRALRDQGFWDRVRIDGIEIVELYEAVAIQAAHAARGLAGQLRARLREHERIEAEPYLRRLSGGRVRQPASYYHGGWWRRLQILRETDHQLSFEVLTERARTEKIRLFLQPALVHHFVREASAHPAFPRQVAETLFELLLPNELKEQTQDETHLVLLLDKDTAQYPWELLADRSPGSVSEPFAVCAGVIRQLRTQQNEFRSEVRVPRDRFALVVGDPPSRLKELPSAQAEAGDVAETLKAGGYSPHLHIRPSGWEVVRELFARDYQILHLAGHGEYNAFHPESSGMVIGENLFLTAAELGQLRAVPPFVFLNCCHLGTIDPGAAAAQQYPRLAASLANALIQIGVRALVVAGWAVEDSVARTFARRLYEALLAGQRFGQAVLLARQAAYRERPEGNTWGAYQCYGDPDFTLDLRTVQESTRTDPGEYVSPREFLDDLAGLQGEAQVATDAAIWDTLRRRADDLEKALPEDWLDGEMLSSLAGVRGDLGDWKLAIEAYRAAITRTKATVTVQDLQNLANLEARYAARLKRSGVVDEALGDPGKLLEAAQNRLHWLLELGETPERLSLVGSAYKRIALAVESDEARKAVLQEAATSYWSAHELTLKEQKRTDPYPALNWVACQIALGSENREQLLALVAECEREGMRLAEADPHFFHRVYGSDALLHRHLIQADLDRPEVEPTAIASYRQVLQKGASFKEISSVAEHLEFLREMIRERSPALAEALLRIRHSLGVIAPQEAPSSPAPSPPPPAGGEAMGEGGRESRASASPKPPRKKTKPVGTSPRGRRKPPAG